MGAAAPPRPRLAAFLHAMVALIGQNFMWYGVYELCEEVCWFEPCDGSVWRELFYVVLGLAMFFASDAFLGQTFVAEAYDDEHVQQARSIQSTISGAGLAVRCFVALIGAMVHNSGAWTLFDVHLGSAWAVCSTAPALRDPPASTDSPVCIARNVGFTVVGLVMLEVSGTLYSNAAVSPMSTLQVPRKTKKAAFKAAVHVIQASRWLAKSAVPRLPQRAPAQNRRDVPAAPYRALVGGGSI